MVTTAGIDIGASAVKLALFRTTGDRTEWLDKSCYRIRTQDPFALTEQAYDEVLKRNHLERKAIDYCATTGEGESIAYSTGHFYSMTTHARGAVYLNDQTLSVMDIGALHGRAIKIDPRGKVLGYKMTSQCASGSGQFLENIARYLGVAQDEIGELSLKSDDPEAVSSICAVLAETDVINMVSRGISASNILKGIHISMADRMAKLLKSIKVKEGIVMTTGGLATDVGLIAALNEAVTAQKMDVKVLSHPDSIYAGAIGAALWGAYRHTRLEELAANRAA